MIDRAVVLVGRSADCDVIIDFSSRISRMHCVFVQVDADYYIRDLGSMNGVRVNGERVEKVAKLVHGAEVAIGDVYFQFRANVQPAPRVAVRSHGGEKRIPALVDESVPILDAEIIDAEIIDAEIIDAEIIDAEIIDAEIIDAEIIDAEIIDDADLVEEFEVVDVMEDVEIVDDLIEVLDFVEEIEVIDEIDVIDHVEVIEDVPIVTNEVRRTRRPPRLR